MLEYYDQPTRDKTPLEMVQEFAKAMGQEINQRHPAHYCGPNDDWPHLELMRWRLIEEEYYELDAEGEPDRILKEMADLVYVVYGYAATFGWDLDEAVRRVHASNMSKLGPDGKPIYREDGKVLKGPNYKVPSLSDLVGGV